MPVVNYEVIQDEERLQEIAAKQLAYAKEHPFNHEAAIKEIPEDAKRETVGPMLRVTGGMMQSMVPYTRFIAIKVENDIKSLQVTYLEMLVAEGRICQLTIADNRKAALEQDTARWLASFYLGEQEPVEPAETPPHVFVGVRLDASLARN